ncbi:AraC family transcriptional regulator [Sphingomonas sp. RIT328]|uniref:AraC family transcriptional regulator n=1 Tax=Sphingomonas sp. RIT328 TaxID=1470591 RepID=UPI00055D518C|nr:AraC family transcriptional regulator [Sphingomonas sp. RIT328]
MDYWLVPVGDAPPIEAIAADYQEQRFRPHWHEGYAVGAVTRNKQGFRCRGRDWIAHEGDLMLINPREVHDGYALDGGWSTRMTYFEPAAFAALVPGLRGSPGWFAAPVVRSSALFDLFREWHDSTRVGLRVERLAQTAPLMAALSRTMQMESPVQTVTDSVLRIVSGPDGPMPASAAEGTLADESARPSRTTSWRRVKASTGVSSKILSSQLRLSDAKRQLASGAALVNAALDAGFYDQSHLSREFASAYGMTAGQFRRRQVENADRMRTQPDGATAMPLRVGRPTSAT